MDVITLDSAVEARRRHESVDGYDCMDGGVVFKVRLIGKACRCDVTSFRLAEMAIP
jgi:hypothetical protein